MLFDAITCAVFSVLPRYSPGRFGWERLVGLQQSATGCGRTARNCWVRLSSKASTVLCSIHNVSAYLYICTYVVHVTLHMLALAGGHLSREVLRSLPGSANGLVRKYIDKKGRRRHVGVPERLKISQRLGCNFTFYIHRMVCKKRSAVLFMWKRVQVLDISVMLLPGAQGPTQQTLENALPVWR